MYIILQYSTSYESLQPNEHVSSKIDGHIRRDLNQNVLFYYVSKLKKEIRYSTKIGYTENLEFI